MPTPAHHRCTLKFVPSHKTAIWHIYCSIIVAEGHGTGFQGLQGVVVFIDNVLVKDRTREEYTRDLQNVLDRLCQAGLHLRKSKCLFFQKSMQHQGHIISKE